jgi:hypothetical protein
MSSEAETKWLMFWRGVRSRQRSVLCPQLNSPKSASPGRYYYPIFLSQTQTPALLRSTRPNVLSSTEIK